MSTSKRKLYPFLDLIKAICAVLVMFIHCFPSGSSAPSLGSGNEIWLNLGQSLFHPILRLAVPTFFIISSFLLFKKIKEDEVNKWLYIRKFCIRTMLLYLFWYIAGIVPTILDIKGFVDTSNWYELTRYIILSFTKGGRRGFWYLIALMLGVVLTALIKGKKSFITMFVISIIFFSVSAFSSTYLGVFKLSNDPISSFFLWFSSYMELHLSLLTSLIYCVIGKYLSYKEEFKIKGHIPLLIGMFFLMVGEVFMTLQLGIFVYPDVFFTMPIFAYLLVTFFLSLESSNERFIKIIAKLRKVGSFLYLYHFLFFYFFYGAFNALNITIFSDMLVLTIIPILLVLVSAYYLQTLFEYLSKFKYLKFLKYSY